jgi:hypothetical protein
MTAVENINPEKEPVPASWVPRVIRGGKGPPEGPRDTENWLLKLDVGTVFLCRQGEKTVDWEEYFLLAKPSNNIYYLKVSLPDGNIWTRRVDPKLFCNYHKDFQVLYVQEKETETEENGSSGECNPL